MYHNQQPTDGRSPSILENHLTSSIFLYAPQHISNNAENVLFETFKTITEYSKDDEYSIDDLGEEHWDASDCQIDLSLDETANTTSLYESAEESEESYAALEPPPNEVYVKSLLETDVDGAVPYAPRSQMDVTGTLFYTVSYYDGIGVEEIAEPEPDFEPDEPIFSAKSTNIEDDLEGDSDLDLESRLGFRN